ncbi:hypothetical protein GGF31_008618 [Allomyces arbusculus]|nr:hypothetical protein GGF31_008618 [Allomyces arbusculus]
MSRPSPPPPSPPPPQRTPPRGQLAPPTGSTTNISSSSPDLPPVRNASWRRARDAIMMPWSTDRRDAGTAATRTPPAQESSVNASFWAPRSPAAITAAPPSSSSPWPQLGAWHGPTMRGTHDAVPAQGAPRARGVQEPPTRPIGASAGTSAPPTSSSASVRPPPSPRAMPAGPTPLSPRPAPTYACAPPPSPRAAVFGAPPPLPRAPAFGTAPPPSPRALTFGPAPPPSPRFPPPPPQTEPVYAASPLSPRPPPSPGADAPPPPRTTSTRAEWRPYRPPRVAADRGVLPPATPQLAVVHAPASPAQVVEYASVDLDRHVSHAALLARAVEHVVLDPRVEEAKHEAVRTETVVMHEDHPHHEDHDVNEVEYTTVDSHRDVLHEANEVEFATLDHATAAHRLAESVVLDPTSERSSVWSVSEESETMSSHRAASASVLSSTRGSDALGSIGAPPPVPSTPPILHVGAHAAGSVHGSNVRAASSHVPSSHGSSSHAAPSSHGSVGRHRDFDAPSSHASSSHAPSSHAGSVGRHHDVDAPGSHAPSSHAPSSHAPSSHGSAHRDVEPYRESDLRHEIDHQHHRDSNRESGTTTATAPRSSGASLASKNVRWRLSVHEGNMNDPVPLSGTGTTRSTSSTGSNPHGRRPSVMHPWKLPNDVLLAPTPNTDAPWSPSPMHSPRPPSSDTARPMAFRSEAGSLPRTLSTATTPMAPPFSPAPTSTTHRSGISSSTSSPGTGISTGAPCLVYIPAAHPASSTARTCETLATATSSTAVAAAAQSLRWKRRYAVAVAVPHGGSVLYLSKDPSGAALDVILAGRGVPDACVRVLGHAAVRIVPVPAPPGEASTTTTRLRGGTGGAGGAGETGSALALVLSTPAGVVVEKAQTAPGGKLARLFRAALPRTPSPISTASDSDMDDWGPTQVTILRDTNTPVVTSLAAMSARSPALAWTSAVHAWPFVVRFANARDAHVFAGVLSGDAARSVGESVEFDWDRRPSAAVSQGTTAALSQTTAEMPTPPVTPVVHRSPAAGAPPPPPRLVSKPIPQYVPPPTTSGNTVPPAVLPPPAHALPPTPTPVTAETASPGEELRLLHEVWRQIQANQYRNGASGNRRSHDRPVSAVGEGNVYDDVADILAAY